MKYIKYCLWVIAIILLVFLSFTVQSDAQTIAFPSKGGTGIGSATAGDVGKFLKVSDDSPFTYILDTAGGSFDSTTVDSTTWSDGANASNIWTFDLSGTDTTITFGSALMTFSHALTVSGITSTPTLTLTGTGTINGLDAIDTTTEDFLEGALDIAGDVDGTGLTAVDLDEAAVETELEGVLDLDALQGAVTDGQVPNTITIDSASSVEGTDLGTLTDTKLCTYDLASTEIDCDTSSAAGAPTDADYLVGTTNGGLSAEIVVGTTPGGELGNTWASPTIDADAVLINEVGDAGAASTIAFDDTETLTLSSASDGETFASLSLTDADFATDTTGFLITAVDNDDANYIPFLIQDDSGGTPDDLFKVSSTGLVTAGSFSGIGTALTALDGENIQDDTIDDDSIDFADVTGVDLTLTDAVAVTTSGKIISNANLDVKNGATGSGILAIFEDSDDGTNKATFQVPALAADTVYLLPPDDGDSGEHLQTDGSGTLTWEAASAAVLWNAIGDASADGSVAFGGTTQTITGDTNDVTAIDQDLLKLSYTNDAATDILTQRGLFIQNEASANGMEALISLNNNDADDVVTSGLIMTSGAGLITTALDVSDAEIGIALAIGSNTITTGATTIASAELDRLDGLSGTIVTTVAGTATLATALAADPADCATSTHFAVGIVALGTATCEAIADADVPDTITIDLATSSSDLTCTDCIGVTEISDVYLTNSAADTMSASVDNGTVLGITNSDADNASDSIVLSLSANDDADANTIYLRAINDADGTPDNVFTLSSSTTGTAARMFLGATGVILEDDADGALTITGNGTGNDESLTFNFDDTSNQIDITTGSAATSIELNSIDLIVPTEVYDATGWNGDLAVPTKDAVRDKIETLSTPTVVSILGKPVGGEANTTIGTVSSDTETTMILGLVSIPYQITVNSITIEAVTVSSAGTFDLTVYSEDGGTQKIAVTTASVAAGGNVTTAVASVVLSPGNYYVAINPNGATADVSFRSYSTANVVLFHTVTGEPMYAGTETITADTPDATITPTGLTATASNFAVFRFDN